MLLPSTAGHNAVILARSHGLAQSTGSHGLKPDPLAAYDIALSLASLPSTAQRRKMPHCTANDWHKGMSHHMVLDHIHQRNILASRGKPFNFSCPSGVPPTLSSWPLPSDIADATLGANADASQNTTRQRNFRRRFAGLPGVAPLPHIDISCRRGRRHRTRPHNGDDRNFRTAAMSTKFQQHRSVALMLAIRQPGTNQ